MNFWILRVEFLGILDFCDLIFSTHLTFFRAHLQQEPLAPQVGLSQPKKKLVCIVAASPWLILFFLAVMLFPFYSVFPRSIHVLQEASTTCASKP